MARWPVARLELIDRPRERPVVRERRVDRARSGQAFRVQRELPAQLLRLLP